MAPPRIGCRTCSSIVYTRRLIDQILSGPGMNGLSPRLATLTPSYVADPTKYRGAWPRPRRAALDGAGTPSHAARSVWDSTKSWPSGPEIVTGPTRPTSRGRPAASCSAIRVRYEPENVANREVLEKI